MTKIELLREEMKKAGVDAVIVLDELNQHYLSDFAFTDGLLLITMQSAWMLTDFRYFELAEKRADPAFRITMTTERTPLIEKTLAEDGCKTVGFEGGSVAYETYRKYCETYPAYEFISIGEMIELLRQVKTPAEIEKMQKAQDIADLAFSHILKHLTPNMTEIEVAAELEYVMRRAGAEGPAFETIAVSGDASSIPHGKPRNEKLRAGFLTMDFGAKYDGYLSDMTRTVVIGKADAEIKKVYRTVLDAQLAAITYLKEGADCGEADKIARDIINKDYDGTFGHSLGHSVGLFIHERPNLSVRSFGRKLRVGEIITIEPGIYLYGKYGCRIEDMAAIEKDGIHDFAHSSKELFEIF